MRMPRSLSITSLSFFVIRGLTKLARSPHHTLPLIRREYRSRRLAILRRYRRRMGGIRVPADLAQT